MWQCWLVPFYDSKFFFVTAFRTRSKPNFVINIIHTSVLSYRQRSLPFSYSKINFTQKSSFSVSVPIISLHDPITLTKYADNIT
jgi:hypothetical protein